MKSIIRSSSESEIKTVFGEYSNLLKQFPFIPKKRPVIQKTRTKSEEEKDEIPKDDYTTKAYLEGLKKENGLLEGFILLESHLLGVSA